MMPLWSPVSAPRGSGSMSVAAAAVSCNIWLSYITPKIINVQPGYYTFVSMTRVVLLLSDHLKKKNKKTTLCVCLCVLLCIQVHLRACVRASVYVWGIGARGQPLEASSGMPSACVETGPGIGLQLTNVGQTACTAIEQSLARRGQFRDHVLSS